jgi:hypothetical protein
MEEIHTLDLFSYERSNQQPHQEGDQFITIIDPCEQQRHGQRLQESRKLSSFNFKGSAKFGASQNAPESSGDLEKMMA